MTKQLMKASQKRVDFGFTVTSKQGGNVTIDFIPLLNITTLLMLFWYLVVAIGWLQYTVTILAISSQQSLDAPVKVLQIWLNSFAFGFGLVT